MNMKLTDVIAEMAEELSFLNTEQVAEVIASIIESLLPIAVLEMNDDLIKIDESKLIRTEYLERRKWGKERRELEEQLADRREVLDSIRAARSALRPVETRHGTMILLQPSHMAENGSLLPEVMDIGSSGEERPELRQTSKSRRDKPQLRKKTHTNITYVLDHSLADKIKNDLLFSKFCSVLERTARRIASIHKNEFIFTLREKRDIELPDWHRTILHIRLPEISFDDANALWSLVSIESRKELDNASKKLSEEEKLKFKSYVSQFNVEMDF